MCDIDFDNQLSIISVDWYYRYFSKFHTAKEDEVKYFAFDTSNYFLKKEVVSWLTVRTYVCHLSGLIRVKGSTDDGHNCRLKTGLKGCILSIILVYVFKLTHKCSSNEIKIL